jgi:FkbM family methyltransferase
MNIIAKLNRSYLGKLVRIPLKLIPKNAVFPILSGKLRGKKWIVGSSNHGCWLGTYEYKKRKLMEGLVTQNSIFYDIGSHAGFYTLLGSVLVGPAGKVISFEPHPRNIYYLKKHKELNSLDNVIIIEAAVSDTNGWKNFEEGITYSRGRVALNGALKVKSVSLNELAFKGEIPFPQYIKIDVEGHELSVLKGATYILKNYHPVLFLATHGEEIHNGCCNLLKSFDYKIRQIGKKVDEIVAY